MSFFIKKKSNKRPAAKSDSQGKFKRKKTSGKGLQIPTPKRTFHGQNEEIESDSDVLSDDDVGKRAEADVSSEEEETAQEKKLRLAKEYLTQLELQEKEKTYDEEISKDVISHRLKQDLLEQTGKLQKKVADSYTGPTPEELIIFRGHQLSVTCVVISPDCRSLYSGAKDASIIKWSVKERKRLKTIHGGRKGTEKTHIGHTAQILCMSLTSDGKYLASGDLNKVIHIWNPDTMELLHTFKGHRDAISGLSFRRESHQLFSCSFDRSIKVWNAEEKVYIETLFGHQDKIMDVDSLTREKVVSCGARDNSVRVWKIIEESQLVFNGHMSSIDCIALINESTFVSGTDDNCLCLWSTMKKKPIFTLRNAHGPNSKQDPSPQDGSVGSDHENWITSVAALVNTDLIASGSKDGRVRLWKCINDYRQLSPLFSIPQVGFVNSLQFSRDGQYLVAAVGQEHRLGRWWRIKKAKNSICLIPLKSAATS